MVEFVTIGKKYKTDQGQIVEVTTGEVLNGQIEFLDYLNAPRLTLVECAVEDGGYIYALNTQLDELE
ncbi:MAG: hypothetical protein ACLRPU_00640 [Enterococcus hulanensis]